MARLKRIGSTLLLGGALLCGPAAAQIASGSGASGPIDITSNSADRYDDKHLAVYRGDVEAVQNGARLLCDTLSIYTYGPNEGPQAKAAPPPPPAGAPGGDSFGSIKQVIAEGHVFYVTQSQTARGEHAVYDAGPDTITMTGNVVLVQGKNVVKGDKMVIDRKTGHTTLVSDVTGRNKPGRVRGVFYNENQSAPSSSAPAQGQAAPAKKP